MINTKFIEFGKLEFQYPWEELSKKVTLNFTNKQSIVKNRVLFLGANPLSSRLQLDEEVRRIRSDLKLSKERDKIEIVQKWAITMDSLRHTILDVSPKIIHISGHGQQKGIILQSENGELEAVASKTLARLFKLFSSNVQCVVLNSCYSEQQAMAIKSHIPHVIGIRPNIPEQAAIAFSTGFYKALGAGRDIPFAFELGIAAIRLEGGSGDDIPILL